MGFECESIAQGETEEDILNAVAAHAKEVHNVTEVSDDMVKKIQSLIREV